MSPRSPSDAMKRVGLNAQGLNLQAVFELQDLPRDVRATLPATPNERWTQLILVGHQGRGFWAALQAAGMGEEPDPVDRFSVACVQEWMATQWPGHRMRFLFPGPDGDRLDLQALGALAGWHHASPFWVGVDAEWGSWFAYRAVLLTDTRLPVTPPRRLLSPCLSCVDTPCVRACPATALRVPGAGRMDGDRAGLSACLDHRLQPASSCEDRCLARAACPVGAVHRYTAAQTAYHYRQSLAALRAWRVAV